MTAAQNRDWIVIGAPGDYTLWAFDAVEVLARRNGAEVRRIDRTHTLEAGTAKRLYLCQYPSLQLVRAIADESVSVLLLTEDPVDSVTSMTRSGEVSLVEAIRAHTVSSVASLAIGRSSKAKLWPRENWRTASEWLVGAAAILPLSCDRRAAEEVFYTLGSSIGPDSPLGRAIAARFPAEDASDEVRQHGSMIAGALGPLARMASGDTTRPIVWPVELLLSGDHPNEPASRVADLAGPARVIYYGPYCSLPPAEYDVEIIIALSGLGNEMSFTIEAHGGTCLARARFSGRANGGYRGSFRLRCENTVDPIELRIAADRGAIEGQLALVEVRLRPMLSP